MLTASYMSVLLKFTYTLYHEVDVVNNLVKRASRESLPFWTPGSVSFFGFAYTPILSKPDFPILCFTRFFTLDTPWLFLDCACRVLHLFKILNLQSTNVFSTPTKEELQLLL